MSRPDRRVFASSLAGAEAARSGTTLRQYLIRRGIDAAPAAAPAAAAAAVAAFLTRTTMRLTSMLQLVVVLPLRLPATTVAVAVAPAAPASLERPRPGFLRVAGDRRGLVERVATTGRFAPAPAIERILRDRFF